MKVEICTSYDAHSSGDQKKISQHWTYLQCHPRNRDSSKEENQQVGVSTHYTLSETKRKPENKHPEAHWYALRTTYGREKKAYDYLVSQPSSKATLPRKPFLPTTTTAMC